MDKNQLLLTQFNELLDIELEIMKSDWNTYKKVEHIFERRKDVYKKALFK